MMNYISKFLYVLAAFMLLQACGEYEVEEVPQPEDPFTYGAKFNWQEDSLQMADSSWVKIEEGHVFSWFATDSILQNSTLAAYDDTSNIKTDFVYTVAQDSLFAIKLSSDTLYFPDGDDGYRTDIKGKLTLSPDTSLILYNTAVSPGVSIKYKLEN